MTQKATRFAVILLVLAALAGAPHPPVAAQSHPAGALKINEFLADNDHVIADEYGEYDDVIELVNAGDSPAALGGMYLTDDLSNPTKFRIPDGTTVAAGQFAMFWADNSPQQGPAHTNFALSKGGESIGLFDTDANGNAAIDTYRFGPQATDVSEGRCPDGGPRWRFFTTPTIGASNGSCARLFLPLIQKGVPLPTPPVLPLRIDCGSDVARTTADGVRFVRDQAWGEGAAFGYVGGRAYASGEWWAQNPVGGTHEDLLYKTQRLGWQEYRISRIPNGSYLLTLGFEEQEAHGPGVHVFDVSAEGRTLLDDFDIHAQVGRYYAFARRFTVDVADGELNLTATASVGESRLSFLELEPQPADTTPPAVPAGLTATPSYGAVLLDWADNTEGDLAGYEVYRTQQPDGPIVRLTAGGLTPISRYQDSTAVPHTPYHYRVSAVDVYGNDSVLNAGVSTAALAAGDAGLPLYQLKVAPADLAMLNSNPFADTKAPGLFSYGNGLYPVEVRYRGSTGRAAPKKSWKVFFSDASPFPNQDRINIGANWLDNSLAHAKLGTLVFEAAGLQPPQAEHVLLMLNGEYLGLYTRSEQIDSNYLARTGRNAKASIYKVADHFAELLASEADYRAWYEKQSNQDLGYEDLIAFIELINNTPDATFRSAIAQAMDVPRFLDYYAILVLLADSDSARHNIYLVHDLQTDKWELIPWDLEIAFYAAGDAPIDMGTRAHPFGSGGWNMLRTRVLAVPEYRAYYCNRLAEYLDTIFSVAAMDQRIDATYDAIEGAGRADWRKWDWEENGPFLASRQGLKDAVRARHTLLRGQMAGFCP